MEIIPEFLKRKIPLLGDGAVGKTSLVHRFVVDKFSDEYIATIGAKVTKKDFRIDVGSHIYDVIMILWDVLGQKGYRGVLDRALHGSNGVIVVSDLTRPETLESMKNYWVPHLREIAGPVPTVILGNKVDLIDDITEAEVAVKELAFELGCSYFLTSAKTGENVEAGFNRLARTLIAFKELKFTPIPSSPDLALSGEIAGVTDMIMVDFCNDFGGVDVGQPLLRKQFDRAGVDINKPTIDSLLKAVDFLADVEKSFKSKEEVERSKEKRLNWIGNIRKP